MDASRIRTVGILGAGTIGSSWATFFAVQGIKVRVYDVDRTVEEKGIAKACANLDDLVEYGLVGKEQLVILKENIASAGSMAALVDGADYIQESAAETYEVKAKVFSEMDRLASPETWPVPLSGY